MEFKILKGNIIDAKVDAIVLPANSRLKVGKGASQAIFDAAGRKMLTKKCKEIGFCEVGSAVPTSGYNLGCRCIIHAVVPKWVDGNHNEYELLSSAYFSSLQLADAMKMKSIAFPVLASGNNDFDLELALEIAFKSIETFSPSELEEATIVVFGNKIAGIATEKGYEVGVLPRDIERDEKEFQKKKNAEKKFENAKNAVQDFAVGQIEGWTDYFKDPANRKKAIETGAEVAGLVIKIAKKVL